MRPPASSLARAARLLALWLPLGLGGGTGAVWAQAGTSSVGGVASKSASAPGFPDPLPDYRAGSINSVERAQAAELAAGEATKKQELRYKQQRGVCYREFFAERCLTAAREEDYNIRLRISNLELEARDFQRHRSASETINARAEREAERKANAEKDRVEQEKNRKSREAKNQANQQKNADFDAKAAERTKRAEDSTKREATRREGLARKESEAAAQAPERSARAIEHQAEVDEVLKRAAEREARQKEKEKERAERKKEREKQMGQG